MIKKTVLSFVLIISLAANQAAASTLEAYQEKRDSLQLQRDELKKEMEELETKENYFLLPDEEKNKYHNEKMQLGMKENKLASYEKAYQMAIEYMQPGKIETQQPINYTFNPITLLPGQAAPKEYIPYYKAAGDKYGVEWSVLAAIPDIETEFSRINLMVSSVGAIGHMQFMPPTFEAYGVDGNGDGVKSPWNLQDAIFSAANYLSISGYSKDVRKAIWHYNHAEWYINDVLETASRIRGAYESS